MASSKPSETADCPICLTAISEADKTYPILCPTKCGYNFCENCVEHLVQSSRADYEMASDGNRHVKVQLQCPQCRGDISNTIHDTLLLRKALVASQYADMPDSELNASELRTKHEFVNKYAEAVSDAEARMRKFHDGGGTTESINIAKKSDDGKKEVYVDTTLFNGLEYAMTEEEQGFVTELMTGGDADQLAQAAQILHGISQISLQGVTPSMRAAKSSDSALAPPVRSKTTKFASTSAAARSGNWKNMSQSEERRQIEALEAQKKLHPLPARMPRYALLASFDTTMKRKTIKFEDDEWDGSVGDAFMRVHKKAHRNNPGVERILSMAEDLPLDARKERVKISAVRGEAGRLGLQNGDIVTHINGERFLGNADQLNTMILDIFNENPSDPLTFSIVVNAEVSSAEILKLRAKALKMTAQDEAHI